MMRVTTRRESSSTQTKSGSSGSAESELKPDASGLSVLMPEPDENALKYQAAADVARDLQAWKAATAVWQEKYMQAHTGPDARNAVEEARAFHGERFKSLREKYAQNPLSDRYLHDQGSILTNQSIALMNAYAQGENERFVESVLDEEERELRDIMTSPDSSERVRKEAFVNYTFKVENWRLGKGESPEAVRAWKDAFSHDVLSEALHARFDRMLARDPEQALRLVRMARGKKGTSPDAAGASDGQSTKNKADSALRGIEAEMLASSENQMKVGAQAKLRKMASEYGKFIPAEQLQFMQKRAEAEKRNRLRRTEERAGVIYSGVRSAMLGAVEGGDLSPLRSMEDELAVLGKTDEARAVTAMREVMAQAQPYLTASRFEPFDRQRIGVRDFFARSGSPAEGKESAPGQVLAVAERGIAERESRFMRDPAGYVASHPLLGREGLSTEEFCRQEGINPEEYFTRAIWIQKQIGKETDIIPRVLPEARAAAIKDQYEGLDDPRKKAELLRQLTTGVGKYAVMVLAEAGLPAGVTAFAPVLPELSFSESAKLARTSGLSLDTMDIPDARKEEIRRQVAGSPLSKALLTVGGLLSASDKPDHVAELTIRALENFVALEGNLPDLERRIALAGRQMAMSTGYSLNMALPDGAVLTSGGGQASPPAAKESGKAVRKPRRSFWERQGHALGVGTRAIVDGAASAADSIASPMRMFLNGVNWVLGGDPNYFRPIGSTVSDAMHLPKPENSFEKFIYAVNKGGTDGLLIGWAASFLCVNKAATSASNIWGNILEQFADPATQAASGVASEVSALAARDAGLGSAGAEIAGTLGGLVGGKVVSAPPIKPTGTMPNAGKGVAGGKAGASGATKD